MSNDLHCYTLIFVLMLQFLHSHFVFKSLIFKVPVTTFPHQGSFEIELMMVHDLSPEGMIFFKLMILAACECVGP